MAKKKGKPVPFGNSDGFIGGALDGPDAAQFAPNEEPLQMQNRAENAAADGEVSEPISGVAKPMPTPEVPTAPTPEPQVPDAPVARRGQQVMSPDVYGQEPTVDTKDIYANEFGKLVHPVGFGLLSEDLAISREMSGFNFWGERRGVYGRNMDEIAIGQRLAKEGAVKLTLEETKQITPWATEPTYKEVAQAQAEQHRIMEGIRSYRGSEPMIGLGVGLLKMATEPGDIALGLATGAAAAAGIAALALPVAGALGVSTVFLSNVAQDLAIQATTAPQLRREGEDITTEHMIGGALMSGVFGTAIHYGTHFLFGGKTKPGERPPNQDVPHTPLDIEAERVLVGELQHESGKEINPNFGEATVRIRRRADINMTQKGIGHYVYRPLTDTADRDFFVSGGPEHTNALTGYGGSTERRIIEVSDNGNFQNNHGDMALLKVEKLNLVDIDQRATSVPAVLATITQAIKEHATVDGKAVAPPPGKAVALPIGPKLSLTADGHLSFPMEASFRDILDSVKTHMPQVLDRIREALHSEGIDGYRYVGRDDGGNPVHNGMVLFDDAKTEIVGTYKQNPDMVPRIPPEEIKAAIEGADKKTSSPYYDPRFDEPQKLLEGPTYMEPVDQFQEKARAEVKEQVAADEKSIKQTLAAMEREMAKLAQEQGFTPDGKKFVQGAVEAHIEEVHAELAEIDKELAAAKKRAQLIRTLGDCVGRGL